MAVTRTTSVFRSDGSGDDGRGSRKCNLRTGVRAAYGRRGLKGPSNVKSGSVATKRGGAGKFFLLGAVLAIQFVGAAAISNKMESDIKVDFGMPQEAEVGSSIELKCKWKISRSKLYSVKWYKDDHEFFQYLPDGKQKIQTFPRPGVNVELRPQTKPADNSNSEKSISLKDLVLESSGQYKCEVSTEAPSFATTYQMANLTVISPPERGPEITGLSSHYAVGENVTANCTAWPSVPKANLRWTINDEPVPRENTVQHPPLAPLSTRGIPNSLGLRLEVESRHFEGGGGTVIIIKCAAQVGSRDYSTERKVQMASVNNQRLRGADGLNSAASRTRAGRLIPLLTAILALIPLTT